MFFFPSLLISVILTSSCSNICDESEYLFENPNLITKANFREALNFDSIALNKNLYSFYLRGEFDLCDPFSLYIKDNYFEVFKRKFYTAEKVKRTGHFIPSIWRLVYEEMLTKTPKYPHTRRGLCSFFWDILWTAFPRIFC